jgi:hypothetical protein
MLMLLKYLFEIMIQPNLGILPWKFDLREKLGFLGKIQPNCFVNLNIFL